MTSDSLRNGSEIAAELRNSSQTDATPPVVPTTLADLLAIWAENPPREAAMLRTTSARLADYHETAVNELTIDVVDRERKGFRSFLENRKYRENSIRTYVNHVRILIHYATAAGWKPANPPSPDWDRVLLQATDQKCNDLARDLASTRKHPCEVTVEDVDQWVVQSVQEGLDYRYALSMKFRFWCILRDCGHLTKLPKCLLREKKYGIPIRDFPPNLRKEVTDLLNWKQAVYVWDRDSDARHRPPTAKRLTHIISTLYGFAVNNAGETGICSLTDLAKRHIIGGFIQWCITEREVKGHTLQRDLRLFGAALRQYPRYEGVDLAWLKKLLDGIPGEPEAVLKKRRAERVLEYAVIEKIPQMLRAQRPKAAKKGHKKLAVLVRDELLIRWFSVLPWRQRNVRECRISGPNPNLFKAPVPAITTIDMPPWAVAERKHNPNAEFWQFHFSEEETKTGCVVDALLPRQLIEPLEEYLSTFRGHLISGTDPGTLFLNQVGKPMSADQVTGVVATIMLRHGGRLVTPHKFRDVVAFAWLKAHPKDYLTLSKMLWHASPKEVIKTYGSLFNESSGVCSMEAWLDEREAKRKD